MKKSKKNRQILDAWILTEAKPPAGLDAAARRALGEAMKRHDFKGRAGDEVLLFAAPPKSAILGAGGTAWPPAAAPLTLLLGARGDARGADRARAIHEAAVRAATFARKNRFAALRLRGVPADLLESAARGVAAALFVFRITARPSKRPDLSWSIDGLATPAARRATILADAIGLARTLVETPPAEKRPAALAVAIRRALPRGLGITVWNEKRLAAERCRGILAVGGGAAVPPRLVRIEYAPRNAKRRLVLVGKGLTFDSGGLNIKTYEGMKTMKCDMAGAAAAVGAIIAIARLGLRVRVTALLGLAENMPGGRAYRPGDVIRMRSGKTVEVLNTDAEGRIVLADLLDIARERPADAIVDLATLTGACVAALGEETAGLFTGNEALAQSLLDAADMAGEPLWRLPLGRDFREKVKGGIADLKNVGNRYGGASSAAAFLEAFAEGKTPWAHLDIAGPAYRESGRAGRPPGATGFGVATLVEYARRLA
jgi:leucyl aminopeptidase